MTHFMAHGTYNMHIIILYHCITRVSSPFPKDVLCSIILYSHSIITSVDYILQNYQWILSKPARRRASPCICPGFISALTLDQSFVQILLARKIRKRICFQASTMQQTNMATENQPFQKEIHLQTWLLFRCHVRFQAGIYLRISEGQHPASKKKRQKWEKHDCVTEARTSIHLIYNLSVFSLFVLSIYKSPKEKQIILHPSLGYILNKSDRKSSHQLTHWSFHVFPQNSDFSVKNQAEASPPATHVGVVNFRKSSTWTAAV